jgi:hypothetical protein
VGFVNVHTAAGVSRVTVYEASVSATGPGTPPPTGAVRPTWPTVEVLELAHAPPGTDALIGLDLLLRLHFLVDGPAGTFSLT